jgi:hypothetical protein
MMRALGALPAAAAQQSLFGEAAPAPAPAAVAAPAAKAAKIDAVAAVVLGGGSWGLRESWEALMGRPAGRLEGEVALAGAVSVGLAAGLAGAGLAAGCR